jgi:hypothetical protein
MIKYVFSLAAAAMLLAAVSPSASLAEEQSMCLVGFDPVAPKSAAYTEEYGNYEGKMAPSLLEYALVGNLPVTWTAPSIPAGVRGKSVKFAIQAGPGAGKGKIGWHELSVNGKKVLRFNTPYAEKLVWQNHGCTRERDSEADESHRFQNNILAGERPGRNRRDAGRPV